MCIQSILSTNFQENGSEGGIQPIPPPPGSNCTDKKTVVLRGLIRMNHLRFQSTIVLYHKVKIYIFNSCENRQGLKMLHVHAVLIPKCSNELLQQMSKTFRTSSTILKCGIFIYIIPSCYIKWTRLLGHPVPFLSLVFIFIYQVAISNGQDFWDTQYQYKMWYLYSYREFLYQIDKTSGTPSTNPKCVVSSKYFAFQFSKIPCHSYQMVTQKYERT